MTNKYDSKMFRCDCGWAFHALMIEPDTTTISVTVVNAPRDLSFWQRVKMAVAVLRGRPHALSEIYIHENDIMAFFDYVESIRPLYEAPDQRRAVLDYVEEMTK